MDHKLTIATAIITVSDRASREKTLDKSGPVLKELFAASQLFHCSLVRQLIVPDDVETIKAELVSLCDRGSCDVIVTTGGTGFSERDNTPEATRAVMLKEANGLSNALLSASLKATPLAALSRLVCGIRNKTLIVNLPGSCKAVKECFELLEPLLPHAVQLLRGDLDQADKVHAKMQATENLTISKVTVTPVTRPRESTYRMLSVDELLESIMSETRKFHLGTEFRQIQDAAGFVLAEDVFASEPHPPFAASVKDGYAVLVADGKGERRVLGASTAGQHTAVNLTPGTCVRVSTGAPVPPGADAVVQVEDTELLHHDAGEELQVLIKTAPTYFQDIRAVGSDISVNDCVLKQGTIIGAGEIGILASLGQHHCEVRRKPLVAVFSTGDELVEMNVHAPLTYGKIRDSNRPSLIALLTQHGIAAADFGIAPDDPSLLLSLLVKALSEADILVTSGGVSMGEKDLLKQVLQIDLGFEILCGRVNMKPGKPTTFAAGTFEGKRKLVFALPGNPVSALVTCNLFVIPACRSLAGFSSPLWSSIAVRVTSTLKLDQRPEFHRAGLTSYDPLNQSGDVGNWAVSLSANQASSRLLSFAGADLLLKLPAKTPDKTVIKEGEIVEALLLK